MVDVREAARQVMSLKLMSKTINERVKPITDELLSHMASAEIRQVGVKDDDGQDLGVVYVGGNRTRKPVVVDEAAFQQWVANTRPQDIVTTVRESARKQILDAAAKAGDPVDPDTGEVIPGVQMHTGDPYLATKPTQYARELMDSTLAESGLLALPGGESDG